MKYSLILEHLEISCIVWEEGEVINLNFVVCNMHVKTCRVIEDIIFKPVKDENRRKAKSEKQKNPRKGKKEIKTNTENAE